MKSRAAVRNSSSAKIPKHSGKVAAQSENMCPRSILTVSKRMSKLGQGNSFIAFGFNRQIKFKAIVSSQFNKLKLFKLPMASAS